MQAWPKTRLPLALLTISFRNFVELPEKLLPTARIFILFLSYVVEDIIRHDCDIVKMEARLIPEQGDRLVQRLFQETHFSYCDPSTPLNARSAYRVAVQP